MRAERWWQKASVIEALLETPTAFEFVQSTRLLRHVPYRKNDQHWADLFDFQSSLNLNFPKAEIESLQIVDEKVALKNLIVGLTGVQGALPYTYTNKIKQAPRSQRQDVEKFVGLFNHKLVSQYVDASLSYHLPIRYEIEDKNHYLDILHALNGYISHQHIQPELDDYFAEFAGLMQGQNNTVYALKTMLNCIFKQQINITEFVMEKFHLDEENKTRLGGSHPSLLGVNSFCGEYVRQIDGKIEIQIGPLDYEDYLSYLPGQEKSIKLKQLLHSWCNPTLAVDVRLILSKDAVHPLQLSAENHIGLGQASFLLPKQVEDNTETCYALLGAAA